MAEVRIAPDSGEGVILTAKENEKKSWAKWCLLVNGWMETYTFKSKSSCTWNVYTLLHAN